MPTHGPSVPAPSCSPNTTPMREWCLPKTPTTEESLTRVRAQRKTARLDCSKTAASPPRYSTKSSARARRRGPRLPPNSSKATTTCRRWKEASQALPTKSPYKTARACPKSWSSARFNCPPPFKWGFGTTALIGSIPSWVLAKRQSKRREIESSDRPSPLPLILRSMSRSLRTHAPKSITLSWCLASLETMPCPLTRWCLNQMGPIDTRENPLKRPNACWPRPVTQAAWTAILDKPW